MDSLFWPFPCSSTLMKKNKKNKKKKKKKQEKKWPFSLQLPSQWSTLVNIIFLSIPGVERCPFWFFKATLEKRFAHEIWVQIDWWKKKGQTNDSMMTTIKSFTFLSGWWTLRPNVILHLYQSLKLKRVCFIIIIIFFCCPSHELMKMRNDLWSLSV